MASSRKLTAIANEATSQEMTAEVKSSKDVEKASAKTQLKDLAPELHLEFFKHLSPVTSACLGVTCKAFYGIHWSLHGKLALEGCDPPFSPLRVQTTFGGLLQSWMLPLGLEWCRGAAKFVSIEQLGLRETEARQNDDALRVLARRLVDQRTAWNIETEGKMARTA